MNFKLTMALMGVVVFILVKSCEMSFPLGKAQAQDCIPVIEGQAQIKSLTTYQSGDVFQLGLYLTVADLPDKLGSFYVLLDPPPNHLRPEALKDAWKKGRTLFIKYLDKICARQKYDEVLRVEVGTKEGKEDLTALFVKPR